MLLCLQATEEIEMKKTWLYVASAAGLTACASAPIPTQQLVDSRADTRAAEELGAKQSPQAALHLQLAYENIDRANKLIAAGDNERAHFVLLRADADAQLALAMSKEANTRGGAQRAVEKLQEMKSETTPTTGATP
jgi:hypothetical protein